LSIAGGTSRSVSPDGKAKVSSSSKVGIILYVIAYVGLVVVCVVSMEDISCTLTGEKRIAAAVILALPLILIRLVYSALEVFVHNHDFNIIDGKVAILVVMAVLEEFVVVLIYLVLGFKTDVLDPGMRGTNESRPWKQSRGRGRTTIAPLGSQKSPPKAV
jgi:hypothetical protein